MTEPAPSRRRASRRYRWLALLPAIALLGGVPFFDKTGATVFGLPTLLVWIVFWAPATSAIMALILKLDGRHDS